MNGWGVVGTITPAFLISNPIQTFRDVSSKYHGFQRRRGKNCGFFTEKTLHSCVNMSVRC